MCEKNAECEEEETLCIVYNTTLLIYRSILRSLREIN
jgi:hypothetical protein